MKKLLWIIFSLFFTGVSAQNYPFEDSVLSGDWSAQQGTLVLSAEHYKDGTQSLCWETSGVSQLIVTGFTSYTASTTNSAFLQIYVPAVNNDTLVVEFMSSAIVRRKANFLCNVRGWREFNRAYKEYATTSNASINALRFTLKPTDSGQRKIYFDDVQLNKTTESGQVPGIQWLLDREYLTTNNRPLLYYANPVDLAITAPTLQELAGLANLRASVYQSVTPAYNAMQAIIARNYVNNNMNLSRNGDGTIRGNVINTTTSGLSVEAVTEILQRLVYLAGAVVNNGAEDMKTAFSGYLEHVLDQGLSEGCNIIFASNSYTAPRTVIPLVLSLIPACDDEQKEAVVKLARWISFYDFIYEPEETYLSKINSDIIYLFASYMQTIAVCHPDDAVAVRELKAFKRFLERNTEYVPGGGDMLKIDGTGFHHNTHYNNYMYAYQSFMDCIYTFKGTEFRISTEAYERFKKAIISIYTMATLNTNDSRHYANSLSGRNPFNSGINVYFSKTMFEKLIDVGGDCYGVSIDEELAGAYNYFFKSAKYSVSENSYEGFHQFNYSPMGIYRKDNWVATMRAPTTKLWGAEIYSGENRFGRYQSHGTLEITYSGTAATSGYPGSSNGGGWDWNVVPGTTTVHYTSWQEMMPNKNTTDRFDQYTKTKNFSGALSWGDCGIFATDFDQGDTWGSLRFTPTNLVFKKSMYAFDDMIISLGSNITSSGTYSTTMITATNLFQNLISSLSGTVLLNGTEITRPNTVILPSGQDNWMITPQGTGYFIPQGNDEIKLIYDTQKTPYETGSDYVSPVTAANAAKAYINHGVKPTGRKYNFVVVPATNSAAMQNLSAQMTNNGGSVYQVHAQNEYLHALTYKPENTTAYTFFGAASNLTFGVVKSSTGGHLLMHRSDEVTGRQYFAASNPNLKPVADATYGWKSSSSQATLTIAGEWLPLQAVEGVQFHAPSNGETQLTLTFNDGEPLYFVLRRTDDTGVDIKTKNDWIKFYNNNLFLWFIPSENLGPDTIVSIYSAVGKLIYQRRVDTGNETFTIPISDLNKGLYICKVQVNGGETATYKWVM